MGEIKNAYTILFRKSQGMKHVWTSTNGWKILKQILEKWIVMLWTEFKWLKMSPDI